MDKIPKIFFVAGLHGNEQLPVKALKENRIDFIEGNTRALKRNTRFTESDLNASFGENDKSYESARAKEILALIPQDAWVVDFHTTQSEREPFVIAVDEAMIVLAQMTGIDRVVVMRHNIKRGHALINYRHGISVEAGRHSDRLSYDTVLRVVHNVREGKKHQTALYEVYDEIRIPGAYENFCMHPDGFIPVLAHEPEYEEVGLYGLKARKLN